MQPLMVGRGRPKSKKKPPMSLIVAFPGLRTQRNRIWHFRWHVPFPDDPCVQVSDGQYMPDTTTKRAICNTDRSNGEQYVM